MTNPNTLDAAELARKVVATGNIHDSGPRIDVIARALLAADARCKQLEDDLRQACYTGLGLAAQHRPPRGGECGAWFIKMLAKHALDENAEADKLLEAK